MSRDKSDQIHRVINPYCSDAPPRAGVVPNFVHICGLAYPVFANTANAADVWRFIGLATHESQCNVFIAWWNWLPGVKGVVPVSQLPHETETSWMGQKLLQHVGKPPTSSHKVTRRICELEGQPIFAIPIGIVITGSDTMSESDESPVLFEGTGLDNWLPYADLSPTHTTPTSPNFLEPSHLFHFDLDLK